MIIKVKTLEEAITLMEVAALHLSQGGTISGFTKEEVEEWSFRSCPLCHVWHNNPESEVCSWECDAELTTTFGELGEGQ